MDKKIEELQKIIDSSNKIVFFGGAGVSTESGIPDFRSVDGLYHQKWEYPPETILSHSFFMKNPEEFYRFYKEKMLFDENKILPNPAHEFLAKLEKSGKLIAVITQNIDGLHEKAGSKVVYNLHGSIMHNKCMKCKSEYGLDVISDSKELVPICPKCGGIIKPKVVLYEEALDSQVIDLSIKALDSADLLIIAGTSLTVYPAAGLINYFHGKNLVIINKDNVLDDNRVTINIKENVGHVLSQIKL